MKRNNFSTSLSYCINLVRKHDYEHYLCTLLLPSQLQPVAFSLRAFNVEVAMIKDSVTEVPIGLARLKFWRDTINSIYKGINSIPEHPVAISLNQVIKGHKLSKRWLTQLLDAREEDLERNTFFKTSELESYCERTLSSLLYLTLEASGIRDVNVDHAASHIGKAQGITTVLRATSYYRSKRQVLIPSDILTRHGASQEDVLRAGTTIANDNIPSVVDSVYDLASLADAHLKKAKMNSEIPSSAKRIFLPAVPCRSFLDALQRVEFNVYSERLTVRNSMLPLSLLWNALRNTY